MHLMVILIWWFGDYLIAKPIKSTPVLFFEENAVEISLSIHGNLPKLNVHQSVFVVKSTNLMSAKCTTYMVLDAYTGT